jgi:hypothetical protein
VVGEQSPVADDPGVTRTPVRSPSCPASPRPAVSPPRSPSARRSLPPHRPCTQSPTPAAGRPPAASIKGKDSSGASFTDTYAEGTEITVTSPAGTTMKFKCVNGSWQQQMRVRNPRLANVVVSNMQMARMTG